MCCNRLYENVIGKTVKSDWHLWLVRLMLCHSGRSESLWYCVTWQSFSCRVLSANQMQANWHMTWKKVLKLSFYFTAMFWMCLHGFLWPKRIWKFSKNSHSVYQTSLAVLDFVACHKPCCILISFWHFDCSHTSSLALITPCWQMHWADSTRWESLMPADKCGLHSFFVEKCS